MCFSKPLRPLNITISGPFARVTRPLDWRPSKVYWANKVATNERQLCIMQIIGNSCFSQIVFRQKNFSCADHLVRNWKEKQKDCRKNFDVAEKTKMLQKIDNVHNRTLFTVRTQNLDTPLTVVQVHNVQCTGTSG